MQSSPSPRITIATCSRHVRICRGRELRGVELACPINHASLLAGNTICCHFFDRFFSFIIFQVTRKALLIFFPQKDPTILYIFEPSSTPRWRNLKMQLYFTVRLSSTPLRHENGLHAFRKRSLNRKNLKTPAWHFLRR